MEVVDFGGRLVLPSLLDGHTHPMMVAGTNWHCIMPATKDREQLLQNIKETAAAIPKEEMPYFYGECYYAETFGEEGPHRQLLDQLIPDRPACIQEYTDHECWYNTMALEMLHVPAVEDDSFVENKAFFMRDEEGKATGWVQEKDADLDMAIYEALDWYPPDGISEKYVEPFWRFIREKGVCALMDASTTREEILQLFYTMDQQNRMKIYYEGALPLHLTDDLDQVLATIVDWRRRYTSRHVHINTMKVFFDGTNEIGTCASLEPLENDSSGKSFGKPELTEEQLVDILLRANDNNVDVHIHVVGDQGFRSCCNSVEKAKKKAGDKWSIFVTLAHCELMTREDAQRATKLGIFFDTTPHDAGGYYGEMAIPYLGKDRWSSMYDYRELLSAGGIIGHSSDVFSYMEANRANPFFGMEVAATRIDRELPLNPEKYEDSVRPPKDAVLPVKQGRSSSTADFWLLCSRGCGTFNRLFMESYFRGDAGRYHPFFRSHFNFDSHWYASGNMDCRRHYAHDDLLRFADYDAENIFAGGGGSLHISSLCHWILGNHWHHWTGFYGHWQCSWSAGTGCSRRHYLGSLCRRNGFAFVRCYQFVIGGGRR